MPDHQTGTQRRPVDLSERIAKAVSHDFRSGVRQIKSFTQLLEANLGEGVDAQSKGYLDVLGSAADGLQTKLEALDRFSTNSTGPLRLKEWVVGEIVAAAAATIAGEIQDAGAVVHIDTSSGAAAKAVVDRVRMETLFIELIRNSLTFCNSPAEIRIELTTVGSDVLVSVIDSGPGFKAEDYDKAFDLFRRFHLQDYPGTGTGLAVVRGILELHGTSPTIRSDPAGGTTVQFTLTDCLPLG